MKEFLLALVAVIVISGCSSYMRQAQFDESLEMYNRLLRWHEWDKASLFARDSSPEESKSRAAAARDIKVVDYRILSKQYNAEKREAIVVVEIDYYRVVSPTVKTLRDTQKWAYVEEKGTKGWKLISPLPEFR